MRVGLGLAVNRGGGSPRLTRAQFVAKVSAILGATPVAGFLPQTTDATTSTCPWSGKVWTPDADMTGQITALGTSGGAQRAFALASTRSLSTPDTADTTFGNGTVDSAFSGCVLANVTDTAVGRTLIAKDQSLNSEYRFLVNSSDFLNLTLVDSGQAVSCARVSSAPITQGAWALFGFSYAGQSGGGATAADNITLYQNGTVFASASANNASYVAMTNLAAPVTIGTDNATRYLDGSEAEAIIGAGLWTLTQHAALTSLCRQFFGVPT